jgi:hypothetical protein
MSETEPLAVASEVPSPNPPASSEGAGTTPTDTPTKHRSGFSRQKAKVARLTEINESLRDDYDRLLGDYHKLEGDYLALEAAFNEVTELNTALADELRRLKSQQRPSPVRYGTTNLMGM